MIPITKKMDPNNRLKESNEYKPRASKKKPSIFLNKGMSFVYVTISMNYVFVLAIVY
ncbi:hypothetical protein FAQ01_20610 [Flavobacterium aquatile]|nr:hypothetical protein FAQ01_20610 [Flavobacterium aquatile]